MRSSTGMARGWATYQVSPSSKIAPHRCSFALTTSRSVGGEHVRVRERLLHAGDHALEALDLGGKILAARFRPFDAQAELEIFLIADQDIRQGGRSP